MNDIPLTVQGMLDYLRQAPPEKVDELYQLVKQAGTLDKVWLPQPGPQYAAYVSEADELLYGGAAGGGKSDLICGLSLTAHRRSLIFRRQSTDLDGLWERLTEVAASVLSSNNSVKKTLVTTDDRKVEGGHLEKPGSEKSWQGRPHDLIAFDEAAQLEEYKVLFVLQWLRSTTPGQRKRAVFATNPPLPEYVDGQLVDFGTGEWLIRWWAPWLDSRFPHPAKDGELRWCYMHSVGDRYETVWVEGPGYYKLGTAERVPDATDDDVAAGRVVAAKSRTFIRSLVSDNAYLANTGYVERLSASPEPLRTLLLTGKFGLRLQDAPMQIIPTQWVLAAQERWLAREHDIVHRRLRQRALAADIAQGGVDSTTVVDLLDENVFGEIDTYPGIETPDGPAVVARLLQRRRDRSLLVLDGTGGWAGDTKRTLSERHRIEAELFIASLASGGFDDEFQLRYRNLRSEAWFTFRHALNPKSGFDIALPPSDRLQAQLTAPHWKIDGKWLLVESKEDLRRRLQSSTDEADVVIMAWFYRLDAYRAALQQDEHDDIVSRYNAKPQEAYDPLEGW